MDKEIEKIDKAIAKAAKAADSKKAKNNPEAKKGAKKILNDLKKRKEELIKLRDEAETARKEIGRAKTDEEKKEAELRELKAEKAFKKFQRAKDPINMICNILKTATGITALVAVFVAASKFKYSSGGRFMEMIQDYMYTGGEHGERNNAKINNALYNIGKHLQMGAKWSVVTEDAEKTNYFPY